MAAARTIGKLAREVGISVETVRFYEREGLIQQPLATGGPRHYDDQTLALLKYIRVAQGFGLSLREIKSLRGALQTGRGFCVALRSLVEAKRIEIDRKLGELRAQHAELGVFLDRCRTRDAHLPCPVVEELASLERAITGTAHRAAS
jgi:MerR family mercuric resistance operon transcriptional regulator